MDLLPSVARLPRVVLIALLTATAWAHCSAPASGVEVRVDCARPLGTIRPLHGGNCGPVSAGGMVDVSERFRELGIPLTRLHDCHWPDPNVVDVHAVFPDLDASPADSASYDFARTDDYVRSVLATGSRVVYRLGESIEHTPVKYRVHPPADPERWAAVCCGIVRHYNEGWADGFRHGIEYWEIWNEPENRPAMWTGTDEQFLRLYAVTAKAIKAEFPGLKVGGPSLGHSGKIVDGRFEPSEFLLKFLTHCRDERLPLDFFSWHLYTNDPTEYVVRALALRALLDDHGFAKTEMHLNEWNYLPGNDWSPLARENQGLPRERFYEEMASPRAAAFVAASLVNMQDAPIKAANFFRADAGDFGLFSAHGTPRKPYYAFKAFRAMLDTPRRVEASIVGGLGAAGVDAARLVACAGVDDAKGAVQVLVSNYAGADENVPVTFTNVPWDGATKLEVFALDATCDLGLSSTRVDEVSPPTRVDLTGRAPVVYLVRLTKR